MRRLIQVKTLLCSVVLAALCVSCSDDDNNGTPGPKEPRIPALDELIGVWNSNLCKFDLDSPGWAYELDLTSDDGFAHDENGDYIRMTVREYCEQYAADYNADPANTEQLTVEEAGMRSWDDNLISRITVDADHFLFEQGTTIGIVTQITGSFEYDSKTGVFTITRDSMSDAGEVVEVSVFVDVDGVMTFVVKSEWFPFHTATYDDTTEYWLFCPTYYYSEKTE